MLPAPIIPMRDLAWATAPVLNSAVPAAAASAARRVNLDCMMASLFFQGYLLIGVSQLRSES
jgi:hypothetical protein